MMEALKHMTVAQMLGYMAGAIAFLSIFIEITPVKINPITHILRWIGKQTNKEVMEKVDELEKKVCRLEENSIVNCRVRILRFSDEIRRGEKHSLESFNQALSDIDRYDMYCSEHPEFINNKGIAAKERIVAVYAECIEKNSFL